MFYENLKKACLNNSTTPSELLKEFKMSTGNTGRWKKGGVPSADVLKKFSERLNVSIDFLLTGNEHEKELPESEKLENCVVFHRDGKTSVKALTAAQVKAIEKLIDSMDGDTPEYL